MSVAALLNKTCTIKRRGTSGNPTTATGGQTGQWSTTVASSVPCAVQSDEGKGDEITLGQRKTGEVPYRVYLPVGTDIRFDDRIDTITGMSNVTLTVTSPGVDDVGRGAYIRVYALHRVGGGTT